MPVPAQQRRREAEGRASGPVRRGPRLRDRWNGCSSRVLSASISITGTTTKKNTTAPTYSSQ
ncbi:hypothetical protein [Streptomyces malaysiensis]|uniref:hypothetical protein n=1 Tax=Streptomyces malaysiensis TaxID=92644 RepID=UPI001F2B3F47|nr:hypothetical protein [Streptomyces autolyticus]